MNFAVIMTLLFICEKLRPCTIDLLYFHYTAQWEKNSEGGLLKFKLIPEFKSPAKIEMAFSQILAIRG